MQPLLAFSPLIQTPSRRHSALGRHLMQGRSLLPWTLPQITQDEPKSCEKSHLTACHGDARGSQGVHPSSSQGVRGPASWSCCCAWGRAGGAVTSSQSSSCPARGPHGLRLGHRAAPPTFPGTCLVSVLSQRLELWAAISACESFVACGDMDTRHQSSDNKHLRKAGSVSGTCPAHLTPVPQAPHGLSLSFCRHRN